MSIPPFRLRRASLALLPILLLGGFLFVGITSHTTHKAFAQTPASNPSVANCFRATAAQANLIANPALAPQGPYGSEGVMFPIDDGYGVLNNNPSAVVIATWSGSGGFGGVFNIGVLYSAGQWYITGYNINDGNVFNVCDASSAMNNSSCICFTQIATADNSNGSQLQISSDVIHSDTPPPPSLNIYLMARPVHHYILEVTPNYSSGVYDTALLAIGLDQAGSYSIYHVDGSPIPANATYNVIAQGTNLSDPNIASNEEKFIHSVTTPTIPMADTFFESTNTDTNALVFVTNFCDTLNGGCAGPEVFDPTQSMPWYDYNAGYWGVASLDDTSTIPSGAAFSVFIIPAN